MPLRPGDAEFPHIEIGRHPEQPERRKRRPFFAPVAPPANRGEHATSLTDQTTAAIEEALQHRNSLGIDPSRLVVLEFNTVNYDTRDDFVERFQAQVVDAVGKAGARLRI